MVKKRKEMRSHKETEPQLCFLSFVESKGDDLVRRIVQKLLLRQRELKYYSSPEKQNNIWKQVWQMPP